MTTDDEKYQASNGQWNVWSKHVLLEMERLNKNQEDIYDKLGDIEAKISNQHKYFVSQKLFFWVSGIIIAAMLGLTSYASITKEELKEVRVKQEMYHEKR